MELWVRVLFRSARAVTYRRVGALNRSADPTFPARYRYALYSSFSPGFQKYLEGLSAVHSAVAQADGARAAGQTVRREPIETVHPVVRVHPVTGWKSVYVNPGKSPPNRRRLLFPRPSSPSRSRDHRSVMPFRLVPLPLLDRAPRTTNLTHKSVLTGFTRRIVGVPKAESDAILSLLFHQIA